MAQLLLLTNALAPSAEVLPALGLLPHHIRVLPAEAAVLVDAPPADAVIVDGRRDLAGARSLCRLLRTTGLSSPLHGRAQAGASPRPSVVVREEWDARRFLSKIDGGG